MVGALAEGRDSTVTLACCAYRTREIHWHGSPHCQAVTQSYEQTFSHRSWRASRASCGAAAGQLIAHLVAGVPSAASSLAALSPTRRDALRAWAVACDREGRAAARAAHAPGREGVKCR